MEEKSLKDGNPWYHIFKWCTALSITCKRFRDILKHEGYGKRLYFAILRSKTPEIMRFKYDPLIWGDLEIQNQEYRRKVENEIMDSAVPVKSLFWKKFRMTEENKHVERINGSVLGVLIENLNEANKIREITLCSSGLVLSRTRYEDLSYFYPVDKNLKLSNEGRWWCIFESWHELPVYQYLEISASSKKFNYFEGCDVWFLCSSEKPYNDNISKNKTDKKTLTIGLFCDNNSIWFDPNGQKTLLEKDIADCCSGYTQIL